MYFVHPSTDISVECRSMLDRYVDTSTDTRPIYRSRCHGRHINRKFNRDVGRYLDRHSADISVDMPTESCCPTLGHVTKPSQNSIETQSSLKPNQPDCHWRLNAQLKSKFQPPSPLLSDQGVGNLICKAFPGVGI